MKSQSDRINQRASPYTPDLEMAASRTSSYRWRSSEGASSGPSFRLENCCAPSAVSSRVSRAKQRGTALSGGIGSAAVHVGSDGHLHTALLSGGERSSCRHGKRLGWPIRQAGRHERICSQGNSRFGTVTGTGTRRIAQPGGSLWHFCSHSPRPRRAARVAEKHFSAATAQRPHRAPSRPDDTPRNRNLAVERPHFPCRLGSTSCCCAGRAP